MSYKVTILPAGEEVLPIRVIADGREQSITSEMLQSACPDLPAMAQEDIEYIHAEVCGRYVVGCMTTAQGQGGLVFVWDTEAQQVIHVSDGEYAVRAAVHDHKVYTLRQVSFWGVRAHLRLDFCPLGSRLPDIVYTEIPLDQSVSEDLSADPADYEIVFDGEAVRVSVKER